MIYKFFRFRPSFLLTEYGWLERLASYKHWNKKSEDLSPVKTLPVLVAPWAAGAKPISIIFAFKSPNPETGFPQ